MLTTNTAVPVSESIAFSVGITMAVVYTVGRFQPPTIGHKKLIEGVIAEAKKRDGKAYVFVSATEDPDLNPLSTAQKIPILEHMFPEGVTFVDTKTCAPGDPPCGGPRFALAWLKRLEPRPAEVHLAIGKDREDEFNAGGLWGEAGPPTSVIPIGSVREAGKVDAANMSGTTARKLAAEEGKKAEFYAAVGYPGQDNVAEVDVVYNRIREWFPRHLKRKPMSGREKAAETREFNNANAPDKPPQAKRAKKEEAAPQAKRARKKGGAETEDMSGFDADREDPPPEGARRRRTYRRCRKCGLPKKPETQ